MATFSKRAGMFGRTVMLEAEGQILSAFADHPQWVQPATSQWLAKSIAKRVAGQFVAQWDRMSRVRSATEGSVARARDADDGLAKAKVKPSRGLKRERANASAGGRHSYCATSPSAGPKLPPGGRTAFGDILQTAIDKSRETKHAV